MRDTGLPLRALREYAALRRVRGEATAARRKQILVEYRCDIARRISELQASLDTLDYKIGNYDQVERKLAAVSPPSGTRTDYPIRVAATVAPSSQHASSAALSGLPVTATGAATRCSRARRRSTRPPAPPLGTQVAVHVQPVRPAARVVEHGVVDLVEEVLERAGHVADVRRRAEQ